MSDFQPFPKIPRLHVNCTITEKIDGSNGQILFEDDGTMKVGSRNRWLGEGQQDNYGFYAWASSNREVLFNQLGPGRHFGEWWGNKIARGYDMKRRQFSLFNVNRWAGKIELPACEIGLGVVPILHHGEFSEDIVNKCTEYLRGFGSRVAAGYMNPEGVVVQIGAYGRHDGNLFKVIISGEKAAVRREHDLLP